MILHSEVRDGVRLVRWDDGENRYTANCLAEWHALLDDIEAEPDPLALVVTGTGKFFSNGLDLEGMTANPDSAGETVAAVHRLLGRMLVLDCYTVAAINGHCFAGGAMLASTFDARVMRSDRGYWCLPEVDLGIPLTSEMFAVLHATLPSRAARDAIITGSRYDAADALELGIVESCVAEAEVVPAAVALATPMASKSRAVIGTHKRQLFGDVAAQCGANPA